MRPEAAAAPGAGATARGLAIAALVQAEEGGRANIVLPRLLGSCSLDEKDRRFATELVYGALRMCRACDWLGDQFVRSELEPVVRAAVRAGTYQLAFMRVPSYAAVSATVAEAPPRARSLVNAVLRRVAGLVEAGPVRWPDIGTRLSYPDWVIQRLGEDLGAEQALQALETMNKAATVSVRSDGYTQDPASQAVAEHLALLLDGSLSDSDRCVDNRHSQPKGTVLDLCAAPGGKATLLAGRNRLVVGADINVERAFQVRANGERLGLGNLPVVVADGEAPPFRPESFSGVLVDAPCSGLGVLRRRPDARWRARPGDVPRLAALQRRLLRSAWPLLAPGGVLVFSVCTLTRAETFDVGEWLAKTLCTEGRPSGWVVETRPGRPWKGLGQGAVLLPQTAGTDGMYMIALRRANY